MGSTELKTKKILTYHCGCHGNLVTIATKYVADAYCLKEAPCQILNQYGLRQRSYKVRKLISVAKHHGATPCHRKHFLSARPLIIGSTSRYRKVLLSSGVPLIIRSNSYHWKDLPSSRVPLIIGETSSCSTSCCR